MGLNVHDVGGYPEGVLRGERDGLRSLRTGRTLEVEYCQAKTRSFRCDPLAHTLLLLSVTLCSFPLSLF